jgi:hypothetical protein
MPLDAGSAIDVSQENNIALPQYVFTVSFRGVKVSFRPMTRVAKIMKIP